MPAVEVGNADFPLFSNLQLSYLFLETPQVFQLSQRFLLGNIMRLPKSLANLQNLGLLETALEGCPTLARPFIS